jgi:hypothetical protein
MSSKFALALGFFASISLCLVASDPNPDPDGGPRSDLKIIGKVSIAPANPNSGDLVTVYATVVNGGKIYTPPGIPVRVGLFVDQSPVGSFTVPTILRVGQPYTCSFQWIATCGDHWLDVVADYPNRIVEEDEENNSSDPLFVPVCRPLPDLMVRKIWMDPDPVPGDRVKIWALVCNTGSVPTPAGVPIGVRFTADGTPCGIGIPMENASTYKSLAPGACVAVKSDMLFKVPYGKFKIEVMADDVNRIAESDETNNSRRQWFND